MATKDAKTSQQAIGKIKLGMVLPNHNTVIGIASTDTDTHVLELSPAGEYVTHWIDPERPNSTSWGHYFGSLGAAHIDLLTR